MFREGLLIVGDGEGEVPKLLIRCADAAKSPRNVSVIE